MFDHKPSKLTRQPVLSTVSVANEDEGKSKNCLMHPKNFKSSCGKIHQMILT
ncbi:MAG: hypothetical protein WD625_01915 [Balneolales bacterium]